MRQHKFYTLEDFTNDEIARCNELAMRVIFDGWKICKQCGARDDQVYWACRSHLIPGRLHGWDEPMPWALRDTDLETLKQRNDYKKWVEGSWDVFPKEGWDYCPTCGAKVECSMDEGDFPYYYCTSGSCVWGEFWPPDYSDFQAWPP